MNLPASLITPLEQLELDNWHLREKKDQPRNRCGFCKHDILVECHGHFHCTYCGQANFVCCDGEMAG